MRREENKRTAQVIQSSPALSLLKQRKSMPEIKMYMITETDIRGEFKRIINNRFRKFLNHAYIHLGCKETAKDIVQETFLTAYQKLSSFEKKSSLETWIFGILNNKISEHHRKQQTENKHIEFNAEEILFHKNGKWRKEWLMDESAEKEITEQQNKLLLFLKHCFTHLSEHYQKIFSLKFFAEKKTNEICKICNCSEDNVWQILHRGKLQLKVCIQSQLKKWND